MKEIQDRPRETPPMRQRMRDSWLTVRTKGEKLFRFTVVFVFIGLACELLLVASVMFWPVIARLNQAQLLGVVLADLAIVFIAAPLLGWFVARPIWRFLDNSFSSLRRGQG